MRFSIFFTLYFFTVLPHTTETPLWVFALAAPIFLHAYFALSGRSRTLTYRMSGLLAILALAVVLYQFKTLLGPEPATALLIILAALKLEELRSPRDGIILLFLLSLLVMYYLLFSQTILSTLYMIAMSVSISVGFIAMNTPREHFKAVLRASPKLVSKDLLLSLPIFLVMFAFFPRFSTPWASLLGDNRNPIGFSENLEPGQMANLARSREVAFRVTFPDKTTIPSPKQLYWRGIALEDTDGWRWRFNKSQQASYFSLRKNFEKLTQKDQIAYQVQIEPRFQKRLFTLDPTHHLQWSEPRMYNPLQKLDGQTFSANFPVVTRLQYDALTSAESSFKEELTAEHKARLLKISPPSEQMAELVKRFKAQGSSPIEIAEGVLNHFSKNNFEYSLSTPEMKTVDDFLFRTKVGFCEHYAAAFAAVMRWSGVPSRVVSGFQGGETNSIGDFLVVRDQHAHSWAEIHDGTSWLRIDPTSAVNAVRISMGSLEQALPEETGFSPGNWSQALSQIQMVLGTIDQRYNQFLLNYNFDAQEKLMDWKMNSRFKRWLLFLASVVGVVLFFFLTKFLLNRRKRLDPIRETYQDILRDLKSAGLEIEVSDGPKTIFQRARKRWPNAAQNFDELYLNLEKLRFTESSTLIAAADEKFWSKKLKTDWLKIRHSL